MNKRMAEAVVHLEDRQHVDRGMRCLICLGQADGCYEGLDEGKFTAKRSGFRCLDCGHEFWNDEGWKSVADNFDYEFAPEGMLWVTDGIEQVNGWYWRHYDDVYRDSELRCKRCLGETKKVNHIHAEHWVCFDCEVSYEAFSPGDMAGLETSVRIPDDVLWVTEGELLIKHPMD